MLELYQGTARAELKLLKLDRKKKNPLWLIVVTQIFVCLVCFGLNTVQLYTRFKLDKNKTKQNKQKYNNTMSVI